MSQGRAGRSHPADVVDAGLQSERTYLAWQRTGLSFAAVGALLIHAAGGVRHPLADVPGLVILAVAAVILLRAVLRYRSIVAAARTGRSAASAALAAAVAAAAALAGVSGLVIAVATVP